MSIVLPVLLLVANVMGAGMNVPQILRLRRRRTVDGVSGVWVGVGIAMNIWWAAYAIEGGLWGMLPVSAAGVCLYSVMAWQYVQIVGGPSLRPLAVGMAGLGMIPMPFLLLDGWRGAGLAIGLSSGLQAAPAAMAAIRAVQAAGISPATWAMAWIEAVIWFIYGIATSDLALLLGGGGGTVMASIVLGRLMKTDLSPSLNPGLHPADSVGRGPTVVTHY